MGLNSSLCLSIPLLLGFLLHQPILKSLLGPNLPEMSRSRSSLIRSLVSKLEAEKELEVLDKSEAWYKVDLNLVKDSEVAEKFVQLEQDEETKKFITRSVDQSDWLFTQVYYNVAKSLLSWFYCQTDINGMLGRGSMFVLSSQQFLRLARDLVTSSDRKLPLMLDLGAGDGRTTTHLAKFYTSTAVTEVSGPMRKALNIRGYTVLDIDNWVVPDHYDLISALNLFDRCDKPISIINDIHKSLKPSTGLLLIALVLPFKPYVESVPGHKPSEKIIVSGDAFEEQVVSIIRKIEEFGYFDLVSWSRVPYLCEGDLSRPLYHLNNVIMLLKKK